MDDGYKAAITKEEQLIAWVRNIVTGAVSVLRENRDKKITDILTSLNTHLKQVNNPEKCQSDYHDSTELISIINTLLDELAIVAERVKSNHVFLSQDEVDKQAAVTKFMTSLGKFFDVDFSEGLPSLLKDLKSAISSPSIIETPESKYDDGESQTEYLPFDVKTPKLSNLRGAMDGSTGEAKQASDSDLEVTSPPAKTEPAGDNTTAINSTTSFWDCLSCCCCSKEKTENKYATSSRISPESPK